MLYQLENVIVKIKSTDLTSVTNNQHGSIRLVCPKADDNSAVTFNYGLWCELHFTKIFFCCCYNTYPTECSVSLQWGSPLLPSVDFFLSIPLTLLSVFMFPHIQRVNY